MFGQMFLPIWGVEVVASIGRLSGNKLVRDWLAPILIGWKSASPQKLMEVDAVQNTQRDYLLDVPWWCRQRFIVRKCASRGKVELV